MKNKTFLGAAFFISLVTPISVTPQLSDRPDGMRFLPDVPGQFAAMTERADALGFHIGTTPNPSGCRHYQAITRMDGADGTPFFLVTRSGNTPSITGQSDVDEGLCDDSDGEKRNGNIIVFRMGSRDKNGERLRSNRLRKGVHVDSTAPPAEDTATIFFSVVDGGLILGNGLGFNPPPPPNGYQHPGGMQSVGKMLAVAVEAPRDPSLPETLIMFFDVSDPEAPVFKSQFAPKNSDDAELTKAGVVAITPLANGLYLMAVAGGDGNTFFFYRSTLPDLSSTALSWNFVGTTPGPVVTNEHQALQFLRQTNIDGPLYLAGARGRIASDNDRIDLFRVTSNTVNFAPGETITLVPEDFGRRIIPNPSTGGDQLANLAAASGFHITPSGELIFYATEHDNDGPAGTVKAGEWRHKNIVRDGSPTLLPTAKVNGTYLVDEGGNISVSGTAAPPITKAFIQLFQDINFGSLYPVVDYDDHALDDFDNFFVLESFLTHNDKAQSWKWHAPEGCSIETIDRTFDGNVDELKTLTGAEWVRSDTNLTTVLNDGGTDNIDQEIDKIDFLPDCGNYYSTPFSLMWDLDTNGSYETTGNQAVFDAARLDGPSAVSVPVQARHPSGGPSGTTAALITVRNVAPAIANFELVDSFGFRVGTDVPFATANIQYFANGSFTDPGKPDHQSAELDFGDGTVVPNTGFDSFNDAFGGVPGQLRESHTYSTTGLHQLGLRVTDDDGGQVFTTVPIHVATPGEVLSWILEQIDLRIAASSDPAVVKALRDARKELAGPNDNSNSGAVDKLVAMDLTAALIKIEKAISDIQRAEAAGGGDLSLIKAYLGAAAESVAQKAYQYAVIAVGIPTSKEALKLETIKQKIITGHASLVATNYSTALARFREAVSLAKSLGI